MKIETKAVHAGHQPEPGSRDVSPAIHLSTNFEKADDGSLPGGYLYSRSGNPNRGALEEALTSLEEGAATIAFSSGNAASAAILQSLAPGDHVVLGEDVFYGTAALLNDVLKSWGLKATFVNMTDLSAVKRAITPATRVLWIETPSNPLLNITDIRAVAGIAKEANANSIVVCDNTWATPLLQLPLQLGADIVMHSVTKYLSGHGDVVSGALVFKEHSEFYQKVRQFQNTGGAVPSPFECWLTVRGLQTFPYRVRAQSHTAQRIADFLNGQPAIETVHYPGLASHPGHKVAAAQMSGFGGMLSVQVKGGKDEALKLASSLKIFTHATSLGGTHSLIEQRSSVEGPATKTPANLLRISIGLEHGDDLIEDLEQALKR